MSRAKGRGGAKHVRLSWECVNEEHYKCPGPLAAFAVPSLACTCTCHTVPAQRQPAD